MTNKTLVRVKVGVKAWIKIYIRHTENMELLPTFPSSKIWDALTRDLTYIYIKACDTNAIKSVCHCNRILVVTLIGLCLAKVILIG